MAQVVYYFVASLQLGGPERKLAFSVPTGNFGDVFAGHVAARMGLPIEQLVVATNVNDILHRALSAGDYSAGTVTPTAAPSMDIQVSSNFERLLFDVEGRDGPSCTGRADARLRARARYADQCPARGRGAAVHQPARRRARHGKRDALGLRRLRSGYRSAHRNRPPRRACGGTAGRRSSGDTRDRTPGEVPRRGGARHRHAALAAAACWRPLRSRGSLYTELAGAYEAVRDHIVGHAA